MSALTQWRDTDFAAPASIRVLGRRSLIVAAVFGVLSLIGLLVSPAQFLRGYLIGYMWMLGLTLGALALLMLYHLTGGAWGYVLRRIFEAASGTLPLMMVLFIPILFGIHSLYVWSRPEEIRHNEHLVNQLQYLSLRWFILRAV